MATRTATRTRKNTATAVSGTTKTRARKTAEPKDDTADLVKEFVTAIKAGKLDGHLAALDSALDARVAANGAAKRTRATAAKSASAKPAARKTTAAATGKLKLEDLEVGSKYKVVDGTKSSKGVDISGQRVTFVRVAKRDGQPVAKVDLNGKAILLAPGSLTVAGRGRPPKPVTL